jgi:hypothetical protein
MIPAVTVCTGFSPAGYAAYGARFLDSFARWWPPQTGLAVYTEEPVAMARGDGRSLWEVPGARAFWERHKDDPRRRGMEPIREWRAKDRRAGYAWRFDVVRFFKQCLIPAHAAQALPDGAALAWLDADVVTFAPVSPALIDQLLGGADLVYLGREAYHSEIGFWAVRLNSRSRQFLAHLARLYRSDGILALPEHHSAFAFDHCRRSAQQRKGLVAVDLTPGGRGHVWTQSPLACCLDHLKGERRKQLGYSPEHPLRWWERECRVTP